MASPGGGPGRARPLRLATRGSPLALHQAELVSDALSRAHPGVVVELVVVRTTGDRRADVAIDRLGGQGMFAKEVQAAVAEGGADVAVHSAKDLPSATPEGLALVAVPPRADPRDAMVGRSLTALGPGATVATGSARRRAQLANLRPDLTFVELRGNMGTRVARGEDGSVAAVVVALAAMERLGWSERVTEVLEVSTMLPQVGQGALALECRVDDLRVADLLAEVDDPGAHRALVAERSFLAAAGGSCTVPVGAYARADADGLVLSAMVASGDGRIVLRASLSGDDPEVLGQRMALHLLEACGGSSIEGWDTPVGTGSGR